MIYSISYGFDKKYLDNERKIKYLLSLNGEYKKSKTTSLLYFKTNLTLEKLVKMLKEEFDNNCYFATFIIDKGNYICINEDPKVFKWLWNG